MKLMPDNLKQGLLSFEAKADENFVFFIDFFFNIKLKIKRAN